MARGVTEKDVHIAADELVQAGERPTVERIRAHLGTGSPNTVTRWLSTWWDNLGTRLRAEQASLELPEAPERVAELAGELWRFALGHARSLVEKDFVKERQALQEDKEALQLERVAFATDAETLKEQVSTSLQAKRLALAQTTELQRLVKQLEKQVEEGIRQRDEALVRATEAEAALQAAESRNQTLHEAATTERNLLTQHVRAVEDRAHAEVDRARQESRQLKDRVSGLASEKTAAEKSYQEELRLAKNEVAEARQHAAAQEARANTLETQLGQLEALSAVVESALTKVQRASAPRKATKKAHKKPKKS